MSNDETISALADAVRDKNKSEFERREALRHVCRLRGEPTAPVDQIASYDLNDVISLLTVWGRIGLRDFSVKDAAQTVSETRATKEHRTKYGR